MSFRHFTNSSRLSGDRVLTNEDIARMAPSVFATDKHSSRSERYAYIPTSEIVAGMRSEGFEPVLAKQGGSRIEGKADFTKHIVRFRPNGTEVVARQIGGLYPEVVILNSHDGTSSYKVIAGLMRLVCLNGLLVADREFGSITVQHKGDVVNKVIEGSFTVIEQSRRAIETAQTWADVDLSRDEQHVMAEAAHVLRFSDSEGDTDTPITPDQLLVSRRREDNVSNLWNVTNRIQENVIRGGLRGVTTDANGRRHRVTTRPINAIDQDVRLNRSLWVLSQRMAELKGTAAA